MGEYIKDESTLVHLEHESKQSFDSVVATFEAMIGSIEGDAFQQAVGSSASPEDFEARMHTFEGPSGFMLFLKLDHGAWMARLGLAGRAYLYILGNPLIARTMIEHNIGVGLNVPVRILIYEDSRNNTGRLAYDLPSSLMERLHDPSISAAAKKLDEKLSVLALAATGNSA